MKKPRPRRIFPVPRIPQQGGPAYPPVLNDTPEAFRQRMAARAEAARSAPVNVEPMRRKRA
ncbi:MAG: hypothetical protein ACREDH_05400 [Methylocella sp.]